MVVDSEVMIAGVIPGEVVTHAIHHQFAKMLSIRIPHADGAMEGRFDAGRIEIVEDVTIAFVVRTSGVIRVEYCIGQSTRGTDDGDRAVFEAYQLGEAARLEEAG